MISHLSRPRISGSKDGDRSVACFLYRGYIDGETSEDAGKGASAIEWFGSLIRCRIAGHGNRVATVPANGRVRCYFVEVRVGKCTDLLNPAFINCC